jgi:hypothetical protein
MGRLQALEHVPEHGHPLPLLFYRGKLGEFRAH